MYWFNTMYYLYNAQKRKALLDISRAISEKEHVARMPIMFDMVWCSLRYGAMFTEYGDLDFYYRSAHNRKTFITTFYNFKLYNQINQKQYRDIFHNKILFLKHFNNFIKRNWLEIHKSTDDALAALLHTSKLLVLKGCRGDSGKEVCVFEVPDHYPVQAFRQFAKENGFDLVEECITNHKDLAELNATSLNTLRIVSVKNNDHVELLFAGIRVGGKDSKIDNISQGGSVARIDIETGRISSAFYTKRSSGPLTADMESREGLLIPMWNEVCAMVKEAAKLVPQIAIVAWDVAITPNGIELIEGNESFGSVIMQVYYGHQDDGLKPRLKQLLQKGVS